MGKKIFVSYKYGDDNVKNLSFFQNSTVRDYVTEFENKLTNSDHIYKGEHDDEDLSEYSDDIIWEKLKNKIYDSSVTIIFISPDMKEKNKQENKQWIPWEISYSLKEISRKNKNGDPVTSKSNAILAVVLPNKDGEYSYYLENKNCCSSYCVSHYTDTLFSIIAKNKFNSKNPDKRNCSEETDVWYGEPSYIKAIEWKYFINNYSYYIDLACERQNNIEDYTIQKDVV